MIEDFKSNFHSSLDELDDSFTRAGLRIVDEMPRLVRGFLTGSQEVIPDARQLAVGVGEDCREVEDRGFVLLALGVFQWLAHRDAQIAVDVAKAPDATLQMAPKRIRLLWWIFVLALPLALLAVGLTRWWLRRRR